MHKPTSVAHAHEPLARGRVEPAARATEMFCSMATACDAICVSCSGVFADFYGRPAYTATLLPKLVARTDARVVTGVAQRLEDGHGFAIHFLAADEDVYCEEEVASARGVNSSVEAAIALAPAQYQWEYKRWRKSPQEMEQQPGWQESRFYARTYSFFSLKGWRRYFKHRRKASKRG